jgi:hypothetical protein
MPIWIWIVPILILRQYEVNVKDMSLAGSYEFNSSFFLCLNTLLSLFGFWYFYYLTSSLDLH